MTISIVISDIDTIETFKVPKSNPPFEIGFIKKSPNVAANGRANTQLPLFKHKIAIIFIHLKFVFH